MRFAALAFAVAVLATFSSVSTASNSVPATYASETSTPITVNDLAPPECRAQITVTVLRVVTGGSFTGNGSAELIIGNASANTIDARGSNDCIVGGGGNDSLTGAGGTDVCLGGLGTDTFATCEHQYQ